MKTLMFIFTLAISFQLRGSDLSNGGYAIVWGNRPANLAAISGQPLNNVMSGWISPNASVVLLKADGTAVCGVQKNEWADVPVGLSNITTVAIGSRNGLALLKDGTITAWGDIQDGNAIVPDTATSVVAIATGNESYVAVKRDGSVIGWGKNKIPPGLSNVTAVAMSTLLQGSNLALKQDGTVVEWSNYDPCAVHPIHGLSKVTRIAVGPASKLALKNDGTVFAWDGWMHGETNVPIGLSNVVEIAVGGFRNPGMAGFGYSLALKKDGTITAWGVMGFNNQPVIVPEGLTNVVAIAAGGNCCLAITTNPIVAERFHQK